MSTFGFLSTLSLRRATNARPDIRQLCAISIHALLAESDSTTGILCFDPLISIHALLAESDIKPIFSKINARDFYPRSPCGERPSSQSSAKSTPEISIHALLAESDHINKARSERIDRFLSTLSLRRATARRASRQQPAGISIHALLAESDSPPDSCYLDNIISIHALLAESDKITITVDEGTIISIHALLAESDEARGKRINRNVAFLSTLSLRRATIKIRFLFRPPKNFYPRSPCGERPQPLWSAYRCTICISIHALLAESDARRASRQQPAGDFYPRSPCGERQFSTSRISETIKFLSTLSLRRATAPSQRHESKNRNFYPRSPCGERPTHCLDGWKSSGISIHALLAESDDAVESIPH